MCHVQLMQMTGRRAFGARCRCEKEKAGWPLNVLPCARITSIRFKGTLSVGACLAVVPTPPADDRVGSPVAVGVAVAILEDWRQTTLWSAIETVRRRATSRPGGAPKSRLYSRLN